MGPLSFDDPDVKSLRKEVFDESKTRFSSWHRGLKRIFKDKSGRDVINTTEQSITYWFIIGQLYFMKDVKKSQYINFFDGEEETAENPIKNGRRPPIISGNTVRLLLGKLLHADLIRESNIAGDKFVYLTDKSKSLFSTTIDEWIVTYDKIGRSHSKPLEIIKDKTSNAD